MITLVLGLQWALARAGRQTQDQSQEGRREDGPDIRKSNCDPSGQLRGDWEREENREKEEEVTSRELVEPIEGFACHSMASGQAGREFGCGSQPKGKGNSCRASKSGERGKTVGTEAHPGWNSQPEWNHGRARGRAVHLGSHSVPAWDQGGDRAGKKAIHPDSHSIPAWDQADRPRMQQDHSGPHSVPKWNQGVIRVKSVADAEMSGEDIDVDPEQERLSKRLQATLSFRVEGEDSDSDGCAEEIHSTFHGDSLTLDTAIYAPAAPTPSYQPPVPNVLIEEGDDGWVSGDEQVPSSEGSSAVQHLVYYDNDVWVDEAKAAFAADKKNTEKLQCLLREMFDSHPDVFSLVLAFVKHSGKNRQPKLSLPRIVLVEFEQWREEKAAGQEEKIAPLTPEHQREALEILIRCHPVVLDPVCSVFKLHSADRGQQLSLVRTLLDMGKLKEAVTYAWKFHLQDHFSMEEMLIPLVAMDKINLIENYIGEEKRLQEQFVMLLDRLCEPGTSYKQLLGLLTTAGMKFKEEDANSKLNLKQLHKLGIRLVRMFNLDLDKFPNLSEKKASGSLHYLLHKKYVEGGITDGNIEELIEATVQASPHLGMQLVAELVRYRDLEAAARWAHSCSIPLDYLHAELQCYIRTHPHRVLHTPIQAPPPCNKEPDGETAGFYELSLPLEKVFFVDSQQSLAHCHQILIKPNAVIGVDAEWRLPVCNRGIERMALLQLAVRDAAFLLDMVNLPKCVPEKTLRQFMIDVFGSNSQLKLGYSIEGDFNLMARSWTFAADVVACPERVVDLQTFAKMVQLLSPIEGNGTNSGVADSILPQHPLLGLQQQMPSDSKSFSPKSQISESRNTSKAAKALHCSTSSKQTSQTSLLGPHSTSTGSGPTSPLPVLNEQSTKEKEPEGIASSDADRWRGLSALVMKCFGKPLDKSQQLSDWERRPLRLDQVKYAALDAFCLLEVYEELKSQALAVDPHFNLEPTISSTRTGRAVFKKQKEEKVLKKTEVVNPPKLTGVPICPRELSVVVDTMLQGVGRYLRCCGVDVKILTNRQNHYDAVRVCLNENRIILTSGSPYFVLQNMVPRGMCVHIGQGKARDQVLEVLAHFNVCVREKDIFSRCQICNGDKYVRISKADFRMIVTEIANYKLKSPAVLRDSTNADTCSTGTGSENASAESGYEQSDQKQAITLQGSPMAAMFSESIPPSPRRLRSSLDIDSSPFVRLGSGLHQSDNHGVIVSCTGITVQVEGVPEGVMQRVAEYYCCVSCGKVFWEGKHFAQVIHQFQHVLDFSRRLSQ